MKRITTVAFAAVTLCLVQGCSQSDTPHASQKAAAAQAPVSQIVAHHTRMRRHHHRYAERSYRGYGAHRGYAYATAHAEQDFGVNADYARAFYDYHSSSTVTSIARTDSGYEISGHEDHRAFTVVRPGGAATVYSGDLNGGVGSNADAYGDGVWVDGYGRRHMRGGFARRAAGHGAARLDPWHGYNFGDENGY